MHEFDFRKLGIRTLLAKKLSFAGTEKPRIFKQIFRFNKGDGKFLWYKFKTHNSRLNSISNQANVCLFTGRYRSIMNECGLKRQIFKRTLMSNYISFMKKKHN